ncbi:TetR family transcriptional regulator [Georgenia sp. 311]|uniref:TetR family transcriptional regulator n=1 Tax=Georgenia wutianyii TaxID=2585135 RepID=A0ABX5VJG0_9MICO|nr:MULTISPECIES: TetR/AcrR family transcriptional regulator [Georgenia]QDB78559.1 TetR family transcriptional regulator [Georgenia wutianyii]TNC16851.1 TetR family transcriptional regulator [Georgenia sp. 311]
MLAEAACELFLEKGYAATSVADITERAGVSRNTFFNYIPTKSDLLWTSVDDAVADLTEALAGSGTDGDAVAQVRAALLRVAADVEPGPVALAFANAEPMGVGEELEESAARRQAAVGRVVAGYLRRSRTEDLTAEVLGTALAGAFLAALRAWARTPVPRPPLPDVLARALDVVRPG